MQPDGKVSEGGAGIICFKARSKCEVLSDLSTHVSKNSLPCADRNLFGGPASPAQHDRDEQISKRALIRFTGASGQL